jgi:hypothetical protein
LFDSTTLAAYLRQVTHRQQITISVSWRVRRMALVRGALSSIAERKTSHGNDRVWKAWKAMMPASHPCMFAFRGVKMESRFGGEAVSTRGLGWLSLMGR